MTRDDYLQSVADKHPQLADPKGLSAGSLAFGCYCWAKHTTRAKLTKQTNLVFYFYLTRANMSELIEQVEQQFLEHKTQPSPPSPTPSATKPKKTARPKPTPLSPPFSVLSVEYRGGERFLAVAPHDSRSLTDVRLLHSGEQQGAWRLKILEPNSAIFAVAAQPDQTVHLP